MKKTTTKTTTTRPKAPEVAGEQQMRSAYEVHTLSQMLYGHLVGHPAWGAAAPMAAPEPTYGFGTTPGMRAWGAGFPTSGPEPPHGFGVHPAQPVWPGGWNAYPGTGIAGPATCRPWCMTGYWKP